MPSVLCYAHDSPLVIHGRRHSHTYSHPLGVSSLTSKDNTICHDSVLSPVRSFVDLSRRLRSSDAAILLAAHTHTHTPRVASQIFPPDSSNVISVLHLKSVSLSVQFSAFIFNISTVSVSIYCIALMNLFQFYFSFSFAIATKSATNVCHASASSEFFQHGTVHFQENKFFQCFCCAIALSVRQVPTETENTLAINLRSSCL